MFALDTNIISELRKQRPHGAVIHWYSAIAREDMALPSVVVYELQASTERTRRQDAAKAAELDLWINRITERLIVLPFGGVEARITASIMTKRSLDLLPDAMIAATALARGLTLVTRNTKDFEHFPVQLLNPFLL